MTHGASGCGQKRGRRNPSTGTTPPTSPWPATSARPGATAPCSRGSNWSSPDPEKKTSAASSGITCGGLGGGAVNGVLVSAQVEPPPPKPPQVMPLEAAL